MPKIVLWALMMMLLFVGTAPHGTAAVPVGNNVTEIVSGFSWIENLWFDGNGGLFFSDFYNGSLWRARRNETTRVVTAEPWVSGVWKRILGISAAPKANEVYVVALYSDGSSGISTVSTDFPQTHSRLTKTPKQGNGLAYNPVTAFLYTCFEGDFIPDVSEIFSINTTGASGGSAPVYVVQDKMWAADGAFMDVKTQLLYVSSSVKATMYVYDVAVPSSAPQQPILQYHAPSALSLDDFCVVNSTVIFAGDFIEGKVLKFAADGGDAAGTVVASGFHAVTSVRQGVGAGWGPSEQNGWRASYFVSEGGSLDPNNKQRGIWEVFDHQ